MKKLSKRCNIKLFIKNTSIVADTDYHTKVCKEFSGTKSS